MITYLAMASLLVSALAGLWLILANLRSGPRRTVACVVVGGLGLFLVMSLFIGPHSLETSPGSPPRAEQIAPRLTAEPSIPTAAEPQAGVSATWTSASPPVQACDTAAEASASPIARSAIDGIELTLVGVRVVEPGTGFLTSTSSQLTLRLAIQASLGAREAGPRRFQLSDLWVLPDPLTSTVEFDPQPRGVTIMAGERWLRLTKLGDLQVEVLASCSIVVDFLVPANSRSGVLYFGFRQLWTFPVPPPR